MVLALIIFIVILSLPFLFRELRQNKAVLLTYFIVVGLHQIVAVINAFWFTVIGADADATTFNFIGFEQAESGIFSFAIGSKFYENMLGVIYSLFGSSHFLGEQLSILAFALSCIVLIKILRQLSLLRYQIPILFVFGALPTMVLLGSITMRESYQVLFFMLAVYFGIKMHLQGNGLNRYFLFMMLSAFIMGLFHKGLIAYMLFLFAYMLFFSLKPMGSLLRVKKLHLVLVVVSLLFMVLVSIASKLQVSGLEMISALSNMDLGKYAETYRVHSVLARATYGVALDISSFYSFLVSSFVLYFYYLFAPFPWQIGNVLDIYAAIESFMRLVLLYYSIKHYRRSYGVRRRLLGLMLILFFSMSFLWAMGTTNYGTAMRHHMLTWWILVVMGMPVLVDKISYLYAKVMVRRDCQNFLENEC